MTMRIKDVVYVDRDGAVRWDEDGSLVNAEDLRTLGYGPDAIAANARAEQAELEGGEQ